MSDLKPFKPMSLDLKQGDFEAAKQARYDQKLLTQLITACSDGSPWAVTSAAKSAGERFGFAWFCQHYPDCPVDLGCRKLRRDDLLLQLESDVEQFARTEVYRLFHEVRQDYGGVESGRPAACVVDRHGDKVPDYVLHSAPQLVSESHPYRVLPDPDVSGGRLYAQRWAWWLPRLADKFRVG